MSGSNIAPATKDKLSLVELKHGRVIFRQKPISYEKQSETLQEMVHFREMMEKHIESNAAPLKAIPADHMPLIAKLAHESDKGFLALSKHIRAQLLPAQDEDNATGNQHSSDSCALPMSLVETAIKSIMRRNNYGLDNFYGGKVSASLCIWRWEVRPELLYWLPKAVREKAEIRLAERVQAKQDLRAIYDGLSKEERDAIMEPKTAGKLPIKQMNKLPDSIAVANVLNSVVDDFMPSPQNSKKLNASSESENIILVRMKKAQDLEKSTKEKERLAKLAAKTEKEKREKEAQFKSRSIMASFFAKSKTAQRTPPHIAEQSIAGPSRLQSDYERTFRPFVVKKDVSLASSNWFLKGNTKRSNHKSSAHREDAIIISAGIELSDGEADLELRDVGAAVDNNLLSNMAPREYLTTIIHSLPPPISSSRERYLKHRNPNNHFPAFSVRDAMLHLTEAEIAGDISVVRKHLGTFQNRAIFPAKVFIFHEDARPGYFGTWTRSSKIVGPRKPFAKDMIMLDYAYDSGEEWEGEPAGDADDVVDDDDDDGGGEEDPDSDLESWLVDDDDEPGSPREPEMSPPIYDISIALSEPLKRKNEDVEKKLSKKRKVVVPLVPFAKGDCWERIIGTVEYEPFKPYRIQFFNDTPASINPFTFVSTCIEDKQLYERKIAGASAPSDIIFAGPLLPDRLANNKSAINGTPSSLQATAYSTISKRSNESMKYPFPDTFLPFLLKRISELQASNIIFLIETLYQDLRVHKVKKNAIEAKVREVGEKDKISKVWVVKCMR